MTAATAEQQTPRRAATLRPTPSRARSRWVIVPLGIALTIAFVLAAYFYVQNTTKTVSVMSTKVEVTRGSAITAQDLTTIQIAGGQQVDTVAAANVQSVIGSTALVDLPPGTLITSANTGTAPAVPAGDSLVGITLTQAQMPAYQVAAGDAVRLVETPVAQGDPPSTTPKNYPATVFTSRYDGDAKVWVVDVVVSQATAPDIAARAATGRLAMVVDTVGK